MIEITKFMPKEKGALKGYLNICIPQWQNFFINDIAYFEMNGKRWVNLPQREYLNKDGEKKYAPYNGFEDVEAKYAFQAQVLQALDSYLTQTTPEQRKTPTYNKSPSSAFSNNNLTQGDNDDNMGLPF